LFHLYLPVLRKRWRCYILDESSA